MLLSKFAALAAFCNLAAAYNPRQIFERARRPAPVIERSKAGSFRNPLLQKRAAKFLNEKTSKYAVNGTGIPDVPFDIGESYAGLLPISARANETRQLFFWFFPSTNPDADREIAIWLNGGPGCSSLAGLLTENGPFTWQAGTLAPTQNPYSWTNLTNMLWVEQPVGVGFSQGVPDISDEVGLSREFMGFYKSFVDTFDAHGWDVYITGESYAGVYVPYIADAYIQANDTKYYNLKGIAINDPVVGDNTNQMQTIIMDYVRYWQNLLYLNDTTLEALQKSSDDCGYTDYKKKYFTFPPPGPMPVPPDPYATSNVTCDVWGQAYTAILDQNPCFNIYHITETCPTLWTVLGAANDGDYTPPNQVVYFNRTDVQKAINAPVGTNWKICSDINVFGLGSDNQSIPDLSPAAGLNGVLQRVIEHTNNTIIGNGDLDMLIPTNGTLLAVQNVTFNGGRGLSEYPGKPFYVPFHPESNGGALSGAGVVGSYGTERGLTFYRVQLAGHELPGYQAGAGYRSLELLLGRIDNLGDKSSFTTQRGR